MHVDLVGLGAVVLLAGLVARLGRRVGLPSIPCYMVVGILFGPGTPGPVLIEHPEDWPCSPRLASCCCFSTWVSSFLSSRCSAAAAGCSSRLRPTSA